MKDITLHATWQIRAPISEVFYIMTDFENWPEYFPKVAESVHIVKREGDHLEIETSVRSFGRVFPVRMQTEVIPGKGFISENESPKFGTSGREEFLLSEHGGGTTIDYTYQVAIHSRWLRIIARPLIGWFSMKYWENAVIDELRKRVEK